ncbi:MAG: hypothetical protein ACLUTU_03625 [Blautia faecis]
MRQEINALAGENVTPDCYRSGETGLVEKRVAASYTIRSQGIANSDKGHRPESTQRHRKSSCMTIAMERDCKKEANAIWKESDKR